MFASTPATGTPVIALDSIDWTPLPARGKTTHATFTGSTTSDIMGGSYTVDVKALGFNLPTQKGAVRPEGPHSRGLSTGSFRQPDHQVGLQRSVLHPQRRLQDYDGGQG